MKEYEDVEIELGNGKRKFFLKIELNPLRIMVDTKALPQTAFLCAMFDGIDCEVMMCGEKGNLKRYFIDIEWVINDWGGDKEIVEAVKKRKQMIIDEIPDLKEKYRI